MTGRERLARVLSALAMLGLAPALVVIPAHRAVDRVRAAEPALERAFDAMDEGLRRGVDCAPVPARTDRISAARYLENRARLGSDAHEVALAAFAPTDAPLGDHIPGGTGLRDLRTAWLALSDDLRRLDRERVCGGDSDLPANRLAEEQARSDLILANAQGQFAVHAARFSAARASLEAGRPLLAALAWTLGVIEVVGWTLVLVMLPGDIRALLGRRAAARSAGPGAP